MRGNFVAGVLGAAAILGAGVVAIGQAKEGGGDYIYACVNRQGEIRIVENADQCRKRETLIKWSVNGGGVGPQGATGPQGPAGPAGPQGPAGSTGPQGPAGADGANGGIGPQGPIGVAGAVGPQGPVGPAGATGNTGPQGPIGPAGATGNTGAQGPAGPPGPAGATGNTGAQGPIGPAGPPGATGNTGSQGPTGPQGPQGATGPQGPSGAAGVSGIEVVVAISALDSNASKIVSAACPAGKRALGGGASIIPGNALLALGTHAPMVSNGNPVGWTAEGHETAAFAGAWAVQVQAICAFVN